MNDSLSALGNEMISLRERITRNDKIAKHIATLEKELRKNLRELRKHRQILRKEEEDVNKLEGASVTSLFLGILGSKSKQLEIERQEYLIAALKYNEYIDTIEMLEYEVSVLSQIHTDSAKLQEKWVSLLEKKAIHLRRSRTPAATHLKILDKKEADLVERRVQIEEALKAGTVAMRNLTYMRKDLQKIKAWGHWQMYGEGRYSSYAKKSFVDKARSRALKAKLHLNTFSSELYDVFRTLNVSDRFNIEYFDTFLNVFYDNLITDWIVQRGIAHAVNNVVSVHDQVSRLSKTLQQEKRTLEKNLNAISKEKKEAIATA